MKRIIFIVVTLLVVLNSCTKNDPTGSGNNTTTAKSGTIDSSFGVNGVATLWDASSHMHPIDAAIQADGKTYILGYSENSFYFNRLNKLNEDGSFDNSFSYDGKIDFDINGSTSGGSNFKQNASALGLLPNGKLIVAGTGLTEGYPFSYSTLLLRRINADGTIDNSFGVNGLLKDTVEKGNVKVVSSTNIYGMAGCTIVAINVLSDGSFILLGISVVDDATLTKYIEKIALIKYNANGTRDNSFGTNGRAFVNMGTYSNIANINFSNYLGPLANAAASASIVTDNTGKLLIEVSDPTNTNTNYLNKLLLRVNSNGTLDNSFGINGIVKISNNLISNIGANSTGAGFFANPMVIQSNGNIIVGGGMNYASGEMFYAGSFTNSGIVDNSFANNGVFTTTYGTTSFDEIASIGIQSTGKIVLYGQTSDNTTGRVDIALCRLNTNGSIDNTFGNAGKMITTLYPALSSHNHQMIIDSKDRINIFGSTINGIFSQIRYNK